MLKPEEIDVFVCYRQRDGMEYAQWLFDSLNRIVVNHGAGNSVSIRVFFDQQTGAVGDWISDADAALRSAHAMIVVSTPGLRAELSDDQRIDQAYEEIRFWCENRSQPPIVVDTDATDRGKWTPKPITEKWPNLNRFLYPDGEGQQRFIDRVISSITASETTVAREHAAQVSRLNEELTAVNRSLKAKSSRLSFASAALLLLLTAAIYLGVSFRNSAMTAETAVSTLIQLIDSSDPDGIAMGPSTDTYTNLVLAIAGSNLIDSIGDPLSRARLLTAIGSTYTGFELHDRALTALSRASRLERALNDPADQFRLALALGEAWLYQDEFQSASEWLDKASGLAETTDSVSVDQRSHLLVALGDLQAWSPTGSIRRARLFYLDALRIDDGRDPARAARDLVRLSALAYMEEDLGQAREYARQAETLAQESGSPLAIAESKLNLAAAAYEERRLGEARSLFEETVASGRRHFGDQHPFTTDVLSNLGRVYLELGEDEMAQAALMEAYEVISEPGFGEVSAPLLNNLGVAFLESDVSIAEEYLNRAAQMEADGFEHIVGQSHVHLAELQLGRGDLESAGESARKAMTMLDRARIDSDWRDALARGVAAERDLRLQLLQSKGETPCSNDWRLAIENSRRTLVEISKTLEKRWTTPNYFVRKADARISVADEALQRCDG